MLKMGCLYVHSPFQNKTKTSIFQFKNKEQFRHKLKQTNLTDEQGLELQCISKSSSLDKRKEIFCEL